jgi:hypothetical protein
VEQIEDVPAGSLSSQSLPVARKLELVNEPTADAPAPEHDSEPLSEPDVARDEDIEEEPATQPEPFQAPARPDVAVSAQPSQTKDEEPVLVAGRAPRQKRRRVTAAVGVLAVLTSLLAWIGWARQSRPVAPHHPTTDNSVIASSPAPELQPAAETSAPVATAPPVSSNLEPSKAPQNQPPAAARKTESKPVAGSTSLGMAHASSSKAAECNPPYTVDEAGIRHYKRKCL